MVKKGVIAYQILYPFFIHGQQAMNLSLRNMYREWLGFRIRDVFG